MEMVYIRRVNYMIQGSVRRNGEEEINLRNVQEIFFVEFGK